MLLDRLRYLWREHGYLATALVMADRRPHYPCYRRRLGGLLNAYKKIGYVQTRGVPMLEGWQRLKEIAGPLREILVEGLRQYSRSLRYDGRRRFVVVDDCLSFVVKPIPFFTTPLGSPRWRLRVMRKAQPDYTVLVLVDPQTNRPREFVLLPKKRVMPGLYHVGDRFLRKFARGRCSTPADVLARLTAALARKQRRAGLDHSGPIAP